LCYLFTELQGSRSGRHFCFPMYVVGGLLNVIGTLLGNRNERRRRVESSNHR
jgi:hypothetical protein